MWIKMKKEAKREEKKKKTYLVDCEDDGQCRFLSLRFRSLVFFYWFASPLLLVLYFVALVLELKERRRWWFRFLVVFDSAWFFFFCLFFFLALPWISTYVSFPPGSLSFLFVPWFIPFSSSSLSFLLSGLSLYILYLFFHFWSPLLIFLWPFIRPERVKSLIVLLLQDC
jgi:hypothetical protein